MDAHPAAGQVRRCQLPPELDNIASYARYHAERSPEGEAMVLGAGRVSYRQLADEVDACARALLGAGIGHGDRVACLSTPHPDFFVTFLAATSIGAIWVGLNPKHTATELDFVVGDCSPRILFTRTRIGSRDYRDDIAILANDTSIENVVVLGGDAEVAGGSTLGRFLEKGRSRPDTALDVARARTRPEDAALLVYTSGTTGQPKGALLSHFGLVRCAHVQNLYVPADPVRMLNNLPVNHVGGVSDISCYVLFAGGTIVFAEQFDAEGSLKLIEQERVTVWGQVPTMFQLSLDHPNAARYDLSSLQMVFWAGAPAPAELVRRLMRVSPMLVTGYGLTETVGHITFSNFSLDVDVLANSCGWPAREYEVRIADPHGRHCAVGEPGEIQVRGPFLMSAYWRRPDATAETIDGEGWMHTGDQAVEAPDGTIRIVGRLKEMFKSGGYNVYPREVEQVLEAYPGIAMAAVVAAPDELYYEVGHAFVLLAPDAEVAEDELRAFCQSRLANYKIPKSFTLARDLPMLPIGKIDKQALRASLATA